MVLCKTYGILKYFTFQTIIGLHSMQLHRLRQLRILLVVRLAKKGTQQLKPDLHRELWNIEMLNGIRLAR